VGASTRVNEDAARESWDRPVDTDRLRASTNQRTRDFEVTGDGVERPDKKGTGKQKKAAHLLAPIRPDEIYSRQMLRALTGWGDSAMRAARAGGLKPIYLHCRVFYRGADLVEYIDKAAEAQDGDNSR
jgi:hypothetical protein